MDKKELAAQIASYRHGRVPRELRRRQVLAEAHDLFAERGYSGASMDELAQRVGVSKPVVYDLCGSKEQLFRDVMAAVDEELTAAVAAAVVAEPDDSRKLRAGILAFLRFVETRRAAWVTLLSADAGPAGTALEGLRRTQGDRITTLVLDLLAGRSREPDPLTTAALARAVQGAVDFVGTWWLDHPDIPAEALADLLVAAFSPDLLSLSERSLLGDG